SSPLSHQLSNIKTDRLRALAVTTATRSEAVGYDPLCDTPSRGNGGLQRNFCSAGPTPDLRPRPPRDGTGDHSLARVPGQRTPLRPSASLPLAAAPGRAI